MSDQPDPQRGVSPVAGTAKPPVSKRMLVAAIASVMAGTVGFAMWRGENPPPEPVKEKLPTSLGATVPYTAPQMIIPRLAPPVQPTNVALSSPPTMTQQQPPAIVQGIQAPSVQSVVKKEPDRPKPYMLSFGEPPPPAVKAAAPASGPGPEDESQVAYTASKVDGVQAGLLGDQTFLLLPGILPCTLQTRVDSTFAGPVSCEIAQDIRPHGVTLLGRGSIVHGIYSNATASGQSRLFVQADWVHDPASGCFISFQNAPMSDPTGEAGVDGSVQNHYLARFGAAMLLTLGQMGESLGQAALSKGGQTTVNLNSGGGIESIAQAILRKQIDIPPTITLNQGSTIAVFTTRVLDFSKCYDLKVRN